MIRVSVLLSLGLVAAAAGPAAGDTVKLKNGDSLTGKVVSVLDGKVTLKTDAAGEVKIDLAQVDTLATDEAVVIDLANGTHFSGKAVAASGGAFIVETDGMGTQTVSFTALAAVNKPEKPPANGPAASSAPRRGRGATPTRSRPASTSMP